MATRASNLTVLVQRSRGGRILGAEVLTSWEGRARTITPGRDCAPESHTRRRGVCLRDSDAFSRGRVLRMGGRQVSAPRSGGGPIRRFLTLCLKTRRTDGTGRGATNAVLHWSSSSFASCRMNGLVACRTESAVSNESAKYLCGQTQWKIFSSSTISAFGYGKGRPMS